VKFCPNSHCLADMC